jgi:hypothetical protein
MLTVECIYHTPYASCCKYLTRLCALSSATTVKCGLWTLVCRYVNTCSLRVPHLFHYYHKTDEHEVIRKDFIEKGAASLPRPSTPDAMVYEEVARLSHAFFRLKSIMY